MAGKTLCINFFLYLFIFNLGVCKTSIIFASKQSGIQVAIAVSVPGDIIELDLGMYSGRENCALNLNIDNITIRGVPGRTSIVCNGGEPLEAHVR